MEIWKDIKGFEGYYQVSSFGNVRSVERTVTFKNGVVCKYKGKVNHINGVKTDNRMENLEWVTNGENEKHAINTGLKQRVNKGTIKPKRVYQFDLQGNLINEFESVNEAARQTGISNGSISECACGGRLKQTGGYKWSYEEHGK